LKAIELFERKVYRKILGPVYDNEKENWRVLTNNEIYASVYILGQAFRYSPENAFYIFNQQIYFIF